MKLSACLCRALAVGLVISFGVLQASFAHAEEQFALETQFRGPIDLVVAEDESWLVTANSLSGSLTLVDLPTGVVRHELPINGHPQAIQRFSSTEFLVSCRDSGMVGRFRVDGQQIVSVASIDVGYEPLGMAADSKRAFVGLQATGEIAELDLQKNTVRRRFAVGSWPRFLALTPDGDRLAVGLSGDSSLAVVDTQSGEVLYEAVLSGGINIGHLTMSRDGLQVYFPWMVYRSNPITVGNIRRGWVLASRVARVRMDGPQYREAISLDVRGEAVADPHGIALTPNGNRMVVSSAGTHELLIYRLAELPFVGTGGPGDLIDNRLLRDQDLFFRLELGGRPMGMRPGRDNRTIYVANQLNDCIQVVDLESRTIRFTHSLGTGSRDAHEQLVHRGMTIFHDARRSLDQWYSCNSCHLDGGTNAKAMDTWNDGTELTQKMVLPLAGVTHTAPWTWHGWQNDFEASLQNSFVSTMQGRKASAEDVRALRAYIESISIPESPFRGKDGSLSSAAQRGADLFRDERVGCIECHSGPRFTDGQIHDVGLGGEADRYEGYNTPSLLGAYRKRRFLHDGRAKSLHSVLEKWHRPDEIGGGMQLSEQQVADLVNYLKAL